MDIATDPDFLMAVGDGHRVVVALVAHQGQRVDPRAQLVAGIERRRRQRHQRRVVTDKPLADALAVAAQDIALPVAALFLQVAIEGVPAREPGTRRHEVPPGKANHPLHITLVVALAGTPISVFEQVMRLQTAEGPRSLPRAIRQNARYQTLVIVVENRLGNAAKQGEASVVPVQPRFRRCRRVGRSKAGIAVGKGHNEKMRPMFDPGDDRIRLAKVCLGMTRRVCQRHEHLPQTTAPFTNIILHDGLLTRKTMLVAKTLEDPLRRVVF